MVLLITYELHEEASKDYSNLYAAIKEVSGIWNHPLTSHWLIQTSLTPQQVWDRLAGHIHKNDLLMVVRLTNSYSGWLPQATWDWLRSKLF